MINRSSRIGKLKDRRQPSTYMLVRSLKGKQDTQQLSCLCGKPQSDKAFNPTYLEMTGATDLDTSVQRSSKGCSDTTGHGHSRSSDIDTSHQHRVAIGTLACGHPFKVILYFHLLRGDEQGPAVSAKSGSVWPDLPHRLDKGVLCVYKHLTMLPVAKRQITSLLVCDHSVGNRHLGQG